MQKRNIYVASSWRNVIQPAIVHALQSIGHDVYDFRNPPGGTGFSWSSIDPNWERWTTEQYREALQHPLAKKGYASDINALRACDTCVLVLPSGRSASWEFGYAMGQGKAGFVFQLGQCEPELMYREATILASMPELFDAFGEPGSAVNAPPVKSPTTALARAIDAERVAVRRVIDRLADLDCESVNRDRLEELVGECVRDLRLPEALVDALRRMVKGRSVREVHDAFGAPGDYGYENPVGDALIRLYRGES